MPDRLHPEGAPGLADTLARSLLGDAGYEAHKAATEEATRTALAAQKARSALWSVLTLTALAVAPAVIVAAYRLALTL